MANKSSKSATPSVALFIGASREFSDAIADTFDITSTASRAPFLGQKHGTAQEWSDHCRKVFKDAETEESPIIREAMRLVMTHRANVTVFEDALCYGLRDAAGKVEKYATITTPDAWRNVVSAARAMGATVVPL